MYVIAHHQSRLAREERIGRRDTHDKDVSGSGEELEACSLEEHEHAEQDRQLCSDDAPRERPDIRYTAAMKYW